MLIGWVHHIYYIIPEQAELEPVILSSPGVSLRSPFLRLGVVFDHVIWHENEQFELYARARQRFVEWLSDDDQKQNFKTNPKPIRNGWISIFYLADTELYRADDICEISDPDSRTLSVCGMNDTAR